MNRVIIKKVICILPAEEVERLRQAQRGGLLRESAWREIRVTATEEGVTVHLGNIDEEAARGGYCRAWSYSREFKLMWADLADVSGVERLVELEPMLVARQTVDILKHLKEVASQVKDALAI